MKKWNDNMKEMKNMNKWNNKCEEMKWIMK